ncbi:ABC transporter ATP-binding protein [Metabacillus halosaccharovorans]|uniref:ABC transporter ATP-binding protein n=1 Tax=Metabacillus halosaccharovorans TaxID=930124 RepID=UPI002040498D|nr:ABC transporter ATP-binding protein [Metabacillus halosaccharovorans]MCM3442195.1 ABC transporter ATP-binding protein [Metabacillus halosaccharovorans]
MEPIIELNKVTKVFKNKTAVNEISFSIQKGEIVAILGPNGAGKTTTMNMMLGLLEPSEGNIQLFKKQPKDKFVREKIGAMLQEVSVIDALKVKEVIHLFRSYYPNPLSLEELVHFTGFSQNECQKRANKLSGGQKRRLGFAIALAGNPDVLFFDEPTVGLDVTSRKVFWNTVKELKQRGKTIIFTTHYIQEADDIAERVILFHEGKIVGDGTPLDIKSKLTKQAVTFSADSTIRYEELTALPFVTDVYEKDGRLYVLTEQPDDVLKAIFAKGIPVRNIGVERGRLEDAFEQVTEKREVV